MSAVTAPIGTVSFIERRVVEMVVVVPHDSSNVNDARDRIERTYTLAESGRLVAASNVAAVIEQVTSK